MINLLWFIGLDATGGINRLILALTTVPLNPSFTFQDILLRLLSVLLLIAINAFFVTAEFAMVSVRRSRINQLVEAGDLQAQTVQSLQRSIERLLSTTQIGITLSSLALGWIGESTIAVVLMQGISSLPLPLNFEGWLTHSLAIPVAFFAIAYLQIVLGELCPKSVALMYSEQLARFLGPPSLAISRIFNPFIWILNQSTRALLRFGGIRYVGQGWYNRITPEELQLMIATERESTGLEAEERELLNNVFEFSESIAAEVMIPRTNISYIAYDATFAELLAKVTATGHSRYPVTRESLDDVCGIIDFKNLAEPLAQNCLSHHTSIQAWVKPARFVPEITPLNELLPLMQRSRLEMVMLVDEFGGIAGLITRQDVIDELIGDNSEFDKSEKVALQILDDRTFLVEAQLNLEEVNELLDLELPITDEYQTLGGFLLYQFQKIPTQGETLHFENLDLTIVAAEGPRLYQIRIYRHDEPKLPPSSEIESSSPLLPPPDEDY
ncbi:MAG: hemolysin family protein [Jaaginema sp. PMC 1079.18]|nr:hemolysin family protein [Jaaginema sp. PMC 1080.18]MEC4850981.1 hemolysin family protein [Jaaginema sp. PMC 1079.18]MEC4865816.1 hemolysin family protein [Jaaginema sp. PMC 1078.18]